MIPISKRFFLTISIVIISIVQNFAQDANLSEPNSEELYLNPAFAGTSNCFWASVTYKKNNLFDFYSASVSFPVSKISGGLGFLIANESEGEGILNKMQFSGIYSYQINFKRKRLLSFGFQASIMRNFIAADNIILSDMIDPYSGNVSSTIDNYVFQSQNFSDFSFGTLFLSEKIRTGFSVFHIDKIFLNNYDYLNSKFVFHFGKVIKLKGKKISLLPEVIFSKQDIFNEISIGSSVFFKKISTFFRLNYNYFFHSFSPVVSISYYESKLRISYTYGTLFPRKTFSPTFSHQVSVSFLFNCFEKRKNKNTIFCKKK